MSSQKSRKRQSFATQNQGALGTSAKSTAQGPLDPARRRGKPDKSVDLALKMVSDDSRRMREANHGVDDF
jgi:hypothetical protein